jgi:hypothetical protein
VAVDARTWGPGRFRAAVRAALDEGAIRRTARNRFAAPEGAGPGSAG